MSEESTSNDTSSADIEQPSHEVISHSVADCRRMLAAIADETFTVVFDSSGQIRSVCDLSADSGLSAGALRKQLGREYLAQCRDVLRSGNVVTFDATCGCEGRRRTWALTLVRSEVSTDEVPVLFGAARDVTTSRQNRASLRETAAIQQRLVELLPDAIIIIGSDDRLLYANTAAAKMVGTTRGEDLIGTSIWRFIHSEGRARIHERKRLLHRGQSVDFAEQKLVRLDGEVIPIETASVPIVYQGKRAALVAARDLTGRKGMAEVLRRTLDLFDKAFHLGPAALAVIRLDDGKVLEASKRMSELTGYAAEELIGSDLQTLELWTDAETLERITARIVEHGSIRDAELQIRRKDGAMRTVLGSARRVTVRGKACLLASAIDITERREAASAERESRALLHKIFHASPTAIGILRLEDGRFLDVNKAMADLLGHDVGALLGRAPRELRLWDATDPFAALVEELEGRDAVHDREITLRTASGEHVTTLSSFQRIQVEAVPCILAVMTDITARKEAEEALVQAKEQAEEIAQFRSALLSNMTHEIRTPLTVILGFTSMLHQGIRDEYRQFVHLIERSGRRLLFTLDSLLELAQLESGTLEVDEMVYDLFDVVHGTAESLAPFAEQKDLTFRVELPEVQVYVRFDYDLFSHALTHLIDNAIKFTEQGGITISADVDDHVVRIHVQDTGVGVGEEFRDRLFEAFSQESEGIDRTHQGSGLGLAVAQRLVEQMDGTIRHTSQKGKGSVFTIELPRA